MVGTTVLFGVLLVLIGPIAYFISESRSFTAFIPSIFGVVLVLCGALASRPNMRMHAMHAAVLIALLGAIAAGAMSLPKIGELFQPTEDTRTVALTAQLTMTVICAVFVVLSVRSFIGARRRRREGAE